MVRTGRDSCCLLFVITLSLGSDGDGGDDDDDDDDALCWQVFTVDEMMPHVSHLPGVISKNLLVRDKKKKGLWLVTAPHDATISLSVLAQHLGASGGLRLADEEVLVTKLGVARGCVTPLALINDRENAVHCVVDAKLLDRANERVYFHPMVNSATTGLSPEDFERFLSAIDHVPTVVTFGE